MTTFMADLIYKGRDTNPGFDDKELNSGSYKRVCDYLAVHNSNANVKDNFTFQTGVNRDALECLKILLR